MGEYRARVRVINYYYWPRRSYRDDCFTVTDAVRRAHDSLPLIVGRVSGMCVCVCARVGRARFESEKQSSNEKNNNNNHGDDDYALV